MSAIADSRAAHAEFSARVNARTRSVGVRAVLAAVAN
jgi:hypothetical protein